MVHHVFLVTQSFYALGLIQTQKVMHFVLLRIFHSLLETFLIFLVATILLHRPLNGYLSLSFSPCILLSITSCVLLLHPLHSFYLFLFLFLYLLSLLCDPLSLFFLILNPLLPLLLLLLSNPPLSLHFEFKHKGGLCLGFLLFSGRFNLFLESFLGGHLLLNMDHFLLVILEQSFLFILPLLLSDFLLFSFHFFPFSFLLFNVHLSLFGLLLQP